MCLIDRGIRAVSYTHLDVYKRQTVGCVFTLPELKVNNFAIITHAGGPVSYTHLDL